MDKTATIKLLEHLWTISPSGVAYWPEKKLAVVADLHLSKGAILASSGQFLPPYDSEKTLRKLQDSLTEFEVETLIFLGDSFHDTQGEHYLTEESRSIISIFKKTHTLIWIQGNHDTQEQVLGESTYSKYQVPPFIFRHEPSDPHSLNEGEFEFSGHLHPKHTLNIQGRKIRRPCFIETENQLIMPAFGSYTGGIDSSSHFKKNTKQTLHFLTKKKILTQGKRII